MVVRTDTEICDGYIGDKICDVVSWRWNPAYRRAELVMSLEPCGVTWDIWAIVIGCIFAVLFLCGCVGFVCKSQYSRVSTG